MILKQNRKTRRKERREQEIKEQEIKEQKQKQIEIKNNIIKTKLKPQNKEILTLKVGEAKHYVPASKEWNNSVYAYNKNFTRTLPVKDNIAKKLVKSYFYLSNNKDLARSRRMRSLMRKRSSHLFHVTSPEIKQTNDKVILTVNILNREKQNLTRKIFFFNKRRLISDIWRKKNNLYLNNIRFLFNKNWATKRASANSTYSSKFINSRKKTLNRKHKYSRLLYKSKLNINTYKANQRKLIYSPEKPLIPNFGIKFKSEMNLFTLKNLTEKNFFSSLRKKFYLNFLKHVLSIFKVKVFIPFFSTDNLTLPEKKLSLLNLKNRNKKLDSANIEVYFIINNIFYSLDSYLINKEVKNYHNLNHILKKLNFFISLFLDSVLTKSNVQNKEKKLNLLFKAFFKQYYLTFIENVNKKKVLLSNNFLKLMINNFKLSKFLPGLKLSIGRIYNKKTELNIIDLKYVHVNTDIFTNSIAAKLAKKTAQNKVLKKCLDLVEIPQHYLPKSPKYDIQKLRELNMYESLKLDSLNTKKVVNVQDYLQYILKKIYPRTLVTNDKLFIKKNIVLERKSKNISSKLISVLNSIRYKWIAGVRLETAGRLTRRFTAARAVYKSIYKGSLKDIDYSRRLSFSEIEPSPISLRNQVRSNSQYTITKSKKRIGAFGVRGWISGY